MAAISDYLELELLDHVLNNAAYTSPTTVYLALFTDDPTDAGTGTEVTGGSYDRQTMSFAVAAAGASSTNADIDFLDMPTATVTHIGIYDASTAGNLLLHGALTTSKAVTAGDTLTVASGDLTVTLA